MGVADDTYGTVARVQALIGDLVTSRIFTTETIPTKAQVEVFLDSVAAELNVHLKASGYEVPVALATDPNAYNYLVQANNAGASAIILSAGPSEAWSQPDLDDVSRGRRHMFEQMFRRAIKLIDDRVLPAARTSTGFEELVVGSKLDKDGNANLPIFTRGLSDYPGTRALSE